MLPFLRKPLIPQQYYKYNFLSTWSTKNRCTSLYNEIFALRGWKTEEINGIEFELNSILAERWKGKAYRLVIQRQKQDIKAACVEYLHM